MKLTSRMQRALDAATREARDRGHSWIGTEHVLLALASDEKGVAAQVLSDFGLRESVEERLKDVLDDPRYATASSTVVVDHDGAFFGYMVLDEDGGPLVVDEHGMPKEPPTKSSW